MAKFRQPPQSASEAIIVSKTIASNGTYYASADSADGYNPVVVEVPGEHATIVSKNIVANGTYNASSDSADGYNPVTVAVPEKVIVSKNITANGTYNASSDSADGYDPVTVAVPEKVIVSKNITANGTYNASSDSADGYNPVTVAVPPPALGTKSITSNGTYTASSDNLDGYSQVIVAVSGGALATITVSYTSTFYNKTMTCSKGGTTYTETTTSAGVTVFNVDSSGTWTITCDGVSRTVDVVLEYSTTMALSVTVDVYGPASDTISFTDATGAKTVTTDSSGAGSVTISFIPPNQSITFTSSIAKDPSDLTADYSKSVTIDSNTTEVHVMPDNCLYWWGNKVNITSENPASNFTYVAPTWNTNNVEVTLTGTLKGCSYKPLNAISDVTEFNCITTSSTSINNSAGILYIGNTTTLITQTPTIAKYTVVDANGGRPKYNVTNGSSASGSWTNTLYALWY